MRPVFVAHFHDKLGLRITLDVCIYYMKYAKQKSKERCCYWD